MNFHYNLTTSQSYFQNWKGTCNFNNLYLFYIVKLDMDVTWILSLYEKRLCVVFCKVVFCISLVVRYSRDRVKYPKKG